jgi:hypothetical protein
VLGLVEGEVDLVGVARAGHVLGVEVGRTDAELDLFEGGRVAGECKGLLLRSVNWPHMRPAGDELAGGGILFAGADEDAVPVVKLGDLGAEDLLAPLQGFADHHGLVGEVAFADEGVEPEDGALPAHHHGEGDLEEEPPHVLADHRHGGGGRGVVLGIVEDEAAGTLAADAAGDGVGGERGAVGEGELLDAGGGIAAARLHAGAVLRAPVVLQA